MRTMTKRIAGIALTVMMALAMLVGALPARAYAAETADLTVNGPAGMAGKYVYAVQMFSSEGTQDTGATYKLNTAWDAFFTGLKEGTMDSLTGDDLSAAAYDYVLNLKEGAGLVDFAKEAVDYVRGSGKDAVASLVQTSSEATKTDAGASATFTDLAHGYYLVYPAQGSTSVDRHTDAMLVNIPANKVWNIKSEYPTVDKSIVENPAGGLGDLGVTVDGSWEGNHDMELDSLMPLADEAKANGQSANVGDVLTFKLESTVPDMTGYTAYTFKLHDILSKGLTLLNSATDPKVVVKINGQSLDGDDYTRNGAIQPDGTTKLTIDLSAYLTNDIKTDGGSLAGKKIEVYYQAKVNNQAVIENPNSNDAYVEYTTEPGSTEEGVHDQTKTYTFGFVLDKRAGTADGKPLAGAVFSVYADTNKNGSYDADADTVVKFAAGTDDNAGKWIVSESGSETVTTPENGKLNLAGLATGTYFVKEITAPNGYNPLKDPIKVVIYADIAEDGSLNGHVIDYGDTANGKDDGQGTTTACGGNGEHVITIVNKTGSVLPETGGMGTIAFTVIGAAVVVGGVAWAVRRKNAQH